MIIAAAALLLAASALAWNERSHAAGTDHYGSRLAQLFSRARTGVNAALSLAPAPAPAPQALQMNISTIAGGGFGINLPAKQAPVSRPVMAARDPLGRGYYIVDEALINGVTRSSLIRFINTTSQPVTLAGVTISPGSINLIAGGGVDFLDDTPAPESNLDSITGMAVDPSGNAVYVSVPGLNAIVGINVSAQNFVIANKTIAPGKILAVFSNSLFEDIRALTMDPVTKIFYFIKTNLVYSLDSSGNPTVFAGGGAETGSGFPPTQISLISPLSLAVDSTGALLIGEGKGSQANPGLRVRKVSGGSLTTLVALANFPTGMAVAPDGTIYVAEGNAEQVSRVNGNSLVAVAGGTKLPSGNGQSCTDLASGCGDGGLATSALLTLPSAPDDVPFQIAADNSGVVIPGYFVSGFSYSNVRYANVSNSSLTIAGTTIGSKNIDTIAGNGSENPFDNTPATSAILGETLGVAADANANLFIADSQNARLRFVNRTQQPIDLFPGTPSAQTVAAGHIVTLNKNAGTNDGQVINASLSRGLMGMTKTSNGLFIVDADDGVKFPNTPSGKRSGVIKFINTSASDVTLFPNGGESKAIVPPGGIATVIGVPAGTPSSVIISTEDGITAKRAVIFPADVAVDSAGVIYIVDQNFSKIRTVDPSTGIVNSQSVQPDVAPLTLNRPTGITIRSNLIYIADMKNNRVLRQGAAGGAAFSVIADSTKGINRPRDVAVDSAGNAFVVNSDVPDIPSGTAKKKHQIMQISPNGDTGVVAGTGTAGFSGDGGLGTDAKVNLTGLADTSTSPQNNIGIIALPDDSIVFADAENFRVRMLKRAQNFPPVLAAISNQTMTEGQNLSLTFNATDPNGDPLTFTITGKPSFGTFTDNHNGTATLQFAPTLTDSGTYNIMIMVSDGALTDTKSFALTVNDSNRPPVITVNQLSSPISATSASGASVQLSGTIFDPDGDPITWQWFDGANQIQGASGTGGTANVTVTLSIGFHSIFLQASDNKGGSNSSTSQLVQVKDTVAPVIGAIPANQEFEGDTVGGKVFNFSNPTVTDNIDQNPTLQVIGVPAGNKFPVGTTTVTFVASDSAGNQATRSFTVKVNDTQKPVISGVPASVTFEADTLGGKVFNFNNPTATDTVSGNVNVVASGIPAGNKYPVGTTTVNFTATDGVGNTATASFTVTVTDTTKPTISNVPANLTVEATSGQGAVVNYPLPTATDIVDGNVTVMTDKASGSTFPIGMTTVTFTAKDAHNNTATASFKVTVQDTTAPVFSNVPANKTVATGGSNNSINVTFNLPTATDAVDGAVAVTANPPSGSLFPVGTTTVTFSAQDSRGNKAMTTFTVTVVTVPPPTINGVPADVTVEATSAAGAVVNYVMPTAVSGQGAALPVQTTHPPGTTFPLGMTTVTFTATDNLSLTTTATFKVTVVDTTPPVLNGATPNITTEAPTPAGAIVNYNMPTAVDAVDGAVTVNTDHPSGSLFPIGTTTVTLTAQDSRQNKATRTFTVTVLADVNYSISTFAGNGFYGNGGDGGQATAASFKQIVAVARDKQGRLLILDSGTRTLRRVELDGTIGIIAGNGSSGNGGDNKQATGASFGTLSGVAVDSQGVIYVSDLTYNRVRRIGTDGVISHYAGDVNGAQGSTGDQGTAAGARLRQPKGLAVDAADNLYIADSGNHRIRKIDAVTKVITTVAGNGSAGYSGDSALATTLSLNNPSDVAVDSQNNFYIADTNNQRVRRVDGSTQAMTTLAGTGVPGFGGDDGPAGAAQVNNPTGVSTDGLGNVFIADQNNQRVRRVSKATGKIRTVAGKGVPGFEGDNGPATLAALSGPVALASDAAGDNIFVADSGNLRVRKLSTAAAVNHPPVITSAIGDQTITKGQTMDIQLAATDEDNDGVTFTLVNGPAFATITNANVPQRTATLHLAPNAAGTFTGIQVKADDGKGGTALSAAFSITVSDQPPSNHPPTASAGALAAMVEATSPAGASVALSGSGTDQDGDTLSFSWKDGANVIAATANATVTLALGNHSITLTVSDGKGGSATTPAQAVLVKDSTPPVISGVPAPITVTATSAAGAAVNYTMPTASDLVSGNVQVMTDHASGSTFPVGTTTVKFTATDAANNSAMQSFTVTVLPQGSGGDPTYLISTFAGNGLSGYSGDFGQAAAAALRQIGGLARDKAGNVYIADATSHVVRRVDTAGVITTFAGLGTNGNTGDGKAALNATFGSPSGVVVDSQGVVYVADTANNRVRRITPDGKIGHYVGDTNGAAGYSGDFGSASSAKLRGPRGLAVDAQDNLYICDASNHRIRRVDAVTRVITTVAGNGNAGYNGDDAAATTLYLNNPTGVAVDAQNNFYIADQDNNRIRKVDAATQKMTTIAGTGGAGVGLEDVAATGGLLDGPSGVSVDGAGDVFIADQNNHRVRRISKATGRIKTVAGNGTPGFSGDGGPALDAMLNMPGCVVSDETGDKVFVADTGNLRVRKLATGNVPPPPPNNLPVVAAIANQTLNKGQVLDVSISATDADGDSVSFSLINAPSFATLTNANPAARTATLHLAPSAAGTFNDVKVQATDSKNGTSQSNAFSITVNNTGVNNPPTAVIAGGSVVTVTTNDPSAQLTFNGTGSSDPDGDSLTYVWSEGAKGLGTGAIINTTLGVGTHTVTLTVNDGKGGTGTATQTVNVEGSGPSTLSLNSISPTSGRQGQTIDVVLTGTGFKQGATVFFSGDGITETVTSVTGTQLVVRITIAPNAPLGSSLTSRRHVTVVNPDGVTSTLSRVFAVFPK